MYYVIHIYGRQEKETIEFIDKYVPKNIALDIFSPKRIINKKIKGKWVSTTERCFPGYVFVETNDPDGLYLSLKSVPRFTRLLGRSREGDTYITLTEKECRIIDALANKESDRTVDVSDVSIKEGKKIKVISGPLQGFVGNIVGVDLHKRTVTILIDMCGRKCEVKVGINIVIDAPDE